MVLQSNWLLSLSSTQAEMPSEKNLPGGDVSAVSTHCVVR